MNKPTAMEIKAARAACKRHAEICNVDEQDLWKMHGEEFIEDAGKMEEENWTKE